MCAVPSLPRLEFDYNSIYYVITYNYIIVVLVTTCATLIYYEAMVFYGHPMTAFVR